MIIQRIIIIKLNLGGNNLTTLGVYVVNDNVTVRVKKRFFEQLSNEISKIGVLRELLVVGDITSRTEKR